MSSGNSQRDKVVVRRLRPNDLEAVIAVDSKITHRRRDEYFKLKLAQALADTGIQVSLAAELEGNLVGFLLARVYYGEFGIMEQVAMLDTFGVDPDHRDKGVGTELLWQLRDNLLGLGIKTLQTEVAWDEQEILSFFQHKGFKPAPRFCLDLDLEESRKLAEGAEARKSMEEL
jgi:ribosomal protein S18 acetylase RimI-like enzyme